MPLLEARPQYRHLFVIPISTHTDFHYPMGGANFRRHTAGHHSLQGRTEGRRPARAITKPYCPVRRARDYYPRHSSGCRQLLRRQLAVTSRHVARPVCHLTLLYCQRSCSSLRTSSRALQPSIAQSTPLLQHIHTLYCRLLAP